eukprot:8290680-Pyramimonas_sp.AAC.1
MVDACAKAPRELRNLSDAVFAALSSATAPATGRGALGLSVAHGAIGVTARVQFACTECTFHTFDALVKGVLESCHACVVGALGS